MTENSPIIKLNGESPPQADIPTNLSEEEMLLYSAWAHGMSISEVAHRYALFAFIQSHIVNKGEEPLQRTIERSQYWNNVGPGKYSLNQLGYNQLIRRFGSSPPKIGMHIKYVFIRRYEGKQFSIQVDPNEGKLRAMINDKEMRGVEVCNELENMNATFNIKSNSRNARLLNWIIQDNDYKWKRLGEMVTDESIVDIETETKEIEQVANEDDEQSFPEGEKIYQLHLNRERNQMVVKLAKNQAIKRDDLLCCQVCGFSFVKAYGQVGKGFIEAHHTIPLSEISEIIETKIEDLALVCSNCHRMLHRRRPWLSIDQLKEVLVGD